MSAKPMSATQRFFTRWVDAETAAAMEAHSRAWLVQCPSCEAEHSIWDLGGIRYKAAGQPRMRLRCSACGNSGWHRVYRSANFPTTNVSAWPLVRMMLILSSAVTIVIAVFVILILKLSGAL